MNSLLKNQEKYGKSWRVTAPAHPVTQQQSSPHSSHAAEEHKAVLWLSELGS